MAPQPGRKEVWIEFVESSAAALASSLVPHAKFEEAVRDAVNHPDSPVLAAQLTLRREPETRGFREWSVGSRGDGAGMTYEESLDPVHLCSLRFWPKRQRGQAQADDADVRRMLMELVKSFWKKDARDNKSRLPAVLNDHGNQVFAQTLMRHWEDGTNVFLFFCDLDHFKRVNDQQGEIEGDRIILELAAVLDATVRGEAVAVHRSGDEFFLLYPAQHWDDALRLAYRVRCAVDDHDFRLPSALRTSLSAGIAALYDLDDGTPPQELHSALEKAADRTLKPDGEKVRGTARLAGAARPFDAPPPTAAARHRALCWVKSTIARQRSVGSPWLNLIEDAAHGGMVAARTVDEAIGPLLTWMQIDWHPDDLFIGTAPGRYDRSPGLGPIDALLAVVHGIWRAELETDGAAVDRSLQIRWSSASNTTSLVELPADKTLVVVPCSPPGDGAFELGGGVHRAAGVTSTDTRRALLIRLGNVPLGISPEMFVDVVTVDDRPYREGGLPDLWEATLATLFSAVVTNANLEAIYLYGDESSAPETVRRLKDLSEIERNVVRTAFKTGLTESQIRRATSRLAENGGRVHFVRSEDELLAHLAALVRPPHVLKATGDEPISSGRRFLRREPRLEGMSLTYSDGCRVDTIAEAFPTVVAIATSAPDITESTDQQGRRSRELLDFTVRLRRADQDQVPAFYAEEWRSLENYFQQTFLIPGGPFHDRVAAPERIAPIIAHLANAIAHPGGAIGTRRAILTPSAGRPVAPDGDLVPPQLLSLRVFPRAMGDRIAMRFGFMWRSMEILVGFPHTLYGSVRMSQHIIERLKERLKERGAQSATVPTIELDEVTYTACSLHYFLGEYGERIARRIVDEASL